MAKRTGKGSGKPAPAVIESGALFRVDEDLKRKAAVPYSDELFEQICLRIERGESLITILEADSMPVYGSFFRWLDKNSAIAERYQRAREIQADYLAMQTVKIADEEKDPATARNRVDARKWYAAKVAPKKYGERLEVEHQVNQTFVDKFAKAKERAKKHADKPKR